VAGLAILIGMVGYIYQIEAHEVHDSEAELGESGQKDQIEAHEVRDPEVELGESGHNDQAEVHDQSSQLELVNNLLSNPLKVLNDIEDIKKNFLEDQKKEQLNNQQDALSCKNTLLSLIKTYEKKHPLFLLGECVQGDGFLSGLLDCPLLRRVTPSYRASFEEKVSQQLIEKIELNEESESPINYTSFGCGGAFSEFIILTKVLSKKPNANLVIHFIDHNYVFYVFAADCLGFSRKIIKNQKQFDFSNNLYKCRKYIASKGPMPQLSDNDFLIKLLSNCIQIQQQNEQFLRELMQSFPNAKLSLFIHESTDSYLKYLNQYKLPYADVFSAADIQDEMSVSRGSLDNYIKLCAKTLEKKSNPSNAWLIPKCILSYSLTAVDGAERVEGDDFNGYVLTDILAAQS